MNRQIRHHTLSGCGEAFGNITYSSWTPFVATWYSGSGGDDGGSVTRSGTSPRDSHTVAIDPNVIPLGTLIQIQFANGVVGVYRAEDTGSAIIGRRIDIFDSDRNACFRNGRQDVLVRMVVPTTIERTEGTH